MSKTKIEWTDMTWNPVIGCTKVSEGCQNCYAEKMARRLAAMGKEGYCYVTTREGKWNGNIFHTFSKSVFNQPFHWHKPRRIFVCSMSDLFHPKVPLEFIDKVFAIMALCPQHTFLLLTKRADKALEYYLSRTAIDDSNRVDRLPQYYHVITDWLDDGESGYLGKKWDICETAAEHTDFCKPLPNVHLGVTCENQRTADERIPLLLQIPAAKRFVSLEPLLEDIDLENVTMELSECSCVRGTVLGSDGTRFTPGGAKGIGIDQVIIGCESGPKRRPCKLEWIESIINQCDVAGVKVFVKQITINGKVSHNPNDWPEKFRRDLI